MKKYWLYVDSYAALFSDAERVVVYNILEKKGTKVKQSPALQALIEALQDEENVYGVEVDDRVLEDEACREFVRVLQDHCCGDLVNRELAAMKPVNFPPVLNLQKEREENGEEKYVLNYLSEVHLFLSAEEEELNRLLNADLTAYRGQELEPQWVERILPEIKVAAVRRIYFYGLWPHPEKWKGVMEKMKGGPLVHVITLEEAWENRGILEQEAVYGMQWNIVVKVGNKVLEVVQKIKDLENERTEFVFYVEGEKEAELAEEIRSGLREGKSRILPFYTGQNRDFFERNVYLTEEDVLNTEWERREILARQAINMNAFGKLYIYPDGSVSGGINSSIVGNIREMSLKELLCGEIKRGNAWRWLRTEEPCRGCVYQWLCPSPSDYERILGKLNLCHVRN